MHHHNHVLHANPKCFHTHMCMIKFPCCVWYGYTPQARYRYIGHYHRHAPTNLLNSSYPPLFHTEMLAITVSPQGSVTVNETRRVELICFLACGCSGTILDWSTQSGRPLPPSAMVTRTAGGRTISLVFEQATADVEGLYVCTATNARLGNATEVVRVDVITSNELSYCHSINSTRGSILHPSKR